MQYRETENRNQISYGEQSPTARRYAQSSSHHREHYLSNSVYTDACEARAAPAKTNFPNATGKIRVRSAVQTLNTLYTPDERRRRDATRWTLVQGILAPVQFFVFAVSVVFVVRYLLTGEGLSIATASVVAKTCLLYAIMVTGSIWEREVFGVWLFAPAFFWEDVFSFLVIGLHTSYLIALFTGIAEPRTQMLIALAAYASYVVNAAQFILKLRAARRDERLQDEQLQYESADYPALDAASASASFGGRS